MCDRLGLGLVPEGRQIFPTLTVRENLEMGAYTRSDKAEIAASLASRLKVPQFKVKNLVQQAARFSDAALKNHLAMLHRMDLNLKTSTGNPRLWLEWALVKMGPG